MAIGFIECESPVCEECLFCHLVFVIGDHSFSHMVDDWLLTSWSVLQLLPSDIKHLMFADKLKEVISHWMH